MKFVKLTQNDIDSYLLKDEKTVLFDTVDKVCAGQFFENLEGALNGRKLDYLIVQHMEPDHASLIEDVKRRYPEVKIVEPVVENDIPTPVEETVVEMPVVEPDEMAAEPVVIPMEENEHATINGVSTEL